MVPILDVYTSVVVILIVGWLGGIASSILRIPRIVSMILLGIALYPSLHPSILTTSKDAAFAVAGGAQNPASSIRTMALLIALVRGGLSVKASFFKEMGLATVVLATVPYALELAAMALLAPSIVPKYYAGTTWLACFESASVWAALSPSIVIPNMLRFVEEGLTEAGRLVLTGAPLEVSTALVTEGVMDGVLSAQAAGSDSTTVLGHIPTYVLGSALYGVAFALAYFGYHRLRAHPAALRVAGQPDPTEHIFVFIVVFILCYTTSIDSVNVPWLIGFFAALSCAITTQYLLPDVSDKMCASLKPAWFFAECFLFVLTGCVIRPAIDSGLSVDLFGNFFALLLVGSLARMLGDVLACVCWQWTLLRAGPAAWTRAQWADLARRVAFVWMATTPKATLQGTLGPKVGKTFASAVSIDASYAGPATFVGPAAAVAILYCATLGTLLTFTSGRLLAVHFQEQHDAEAEAKAEAEAAAVAAAAAGGAGEASAAAAPGRASRKNSIGKLEGGINNPQSLGDIALSAWGLTLHPFAPALFTHAHSLTHNTPPMRAHPFISAPRGAGGRSKAVTGRRRYYLPFRALTSWDAPNLLIPGKGLAQPRAATRLHPEEWATGSVAGLAASLMSSRNLTAAQLYGSIEVLQQAINASRLVPMLWTV